MKKLFLMIVGMVMTLSAQAQGQFTLAEGEQFQAGAQVTSVPEITLTFGKEGGADFTAAVADEKVDGYAAYTVGDSYTFVATKNGLVTVAVALNAEKEFVVEQDGEALAKFDGIKKAEDYYGTFSFPVQADKTYKVYCKESSLGFYGFNYRVAQDLNKVVDAYISGHAGATTYSIELEAGGFYTMSRPIEINKGLILTTDKSNPAIIDASGNSKSFILLSTTTPTATLPEGNPSYFAIDNLVLQNVHVTGIRNSIVYDNNKKYCVINLTIDNCVMQLETEAVENQALISFKQGGANDVTIKNSTIYGNNAVARYFIRYNNNNGRVDRYGLDTWSFIYENNTFYGLLLPKAANGDESQWGNYNGVAGKASLMLVSIRNNIWYNCDKQPLRRLFQSKELKNFAKGSSIWNNTIWFNGEASSQGIYTNGSDLTTAPVFADAANGDFTLAEGCAQYENQTGDPRWLKNFIADAVEVSVESGADLKDAVDALYTDKGKPGAITLRLAENGKYTVSGALFVNCPLYINGAEGVEIDAAASNAPFILMRPLPELGLSADGVFGIKGIVIKDVKITGLKNRLFYADRQNYLIDKLAVENSVIQLDGTTPRSIFDFYCGGNYKELSIEGSTLYADPSNAMRGGLVSTQASKSIIEMGGESQKLSIKNSTLYNIAYGKTPVLQQRHSQYYLSFELAGNIIVNCGEKGNFVAGLNEGQKSSAVEWTVDGNAFNFDGENSGANEAYGNALSGVVKFADAAKGDFTQSNVAAGDPRWISGTPTAIETVKTAEETSLENAVIYNLNGQRVDKAQKGLYIVNGKKVVIK